ncbi:MAG: glutathione synthase/RimK-type ligase-like ATP-grasp enzyme [Parasphingorhabdus sp.]|jgi:glutathione synthase/RimK-type ligase-like ATP-grasp enzyme
MKINVLFEHPNWSDALIDVFRTRDVTLDLTNIAELAFDTDLKDLPPTDLIINRINIMPSAERPPQVVFQTLHYLSFLELTGTRMINGSRAHFIGSSKAMQNGIFTKLGLACPKAIAIYRIEDALAAADKMDYPVIVKPNIGGSGSGIAKFDSRQELVDAVKIRSLDLGVDRTGLVQQYINSDGFIYRIEILGDQLFYSIRQSIQENNFNYCAADGCASEQPEASEADEFDFCAIAGGERIQTFDAEPEIIQDVIKIVQACEADVGGVEYFIDTDTGRPCYYDFNPYSNFVTNGEALLGFSPEQRYVDFVLSQYNHP